MMRLPPHCRIVTGKAVFHHMKEGIVYAFGFPPIRSLVFAAKLDNLHRLIRPIYVRKGIIPEVAAGLQAVTGATRP